jgi:hypothetical protein
MLKAQSCLYPALLGEPPLIHYSHSATQTLYQAQIMGNQQKGCSLCLTYFAEHVQYLYLKNSIKIGKRFVQHNERRTRGQSPRNTDTLELSATKLAGQPINHPRIQPNLLQQLGSTPQAIRLGKPHQMSQRLRQAPAHGMTGVKGTWRILEDHLNAASKRTKCLTLYVRQRFPTKADLPTLRPLKSQQQAGQRTFTATTVSQEANAFPFVNMEIQLTQYRLHRLA